MERQRILRCARIAVTALCLTACVLFVGLWVRSYWRGDQVFRKVSSRWLYAASAVGSVELSLPPTHDWAGPEAIGWTWTSATINDLHTHAGFGLARYWIIVPHWFLVILAATSAGFSFFLMPQRFSLRTLLIGTAVVAAGLGVIVLLN